jgi:hypothetical protein
LWFGIREIIVLLGAERRWQKTSRSVIGHSTANEAWETSERLVCLYTFWSSYEILIYVLDKIWTRHWELCILPYIDLGRYNTQSDYAKTLLISCFHLTYDIQSILSLKFPIMCK